jgi:hypothetical protein
MVMLSKLVYVVIGALLLVPSSALAQQPSEIWISRAELLALPMSGTSWNALLNAANKVCAAPNLTNQDDTANVCVMAKALVFARTGQSVYRQDVVNALNSVVNAPTYSGRALALGRELAAYVIAADLIDLKNYNIPLDVAFRVKIQSLLVTLTVEGPQNLIYCHEERPNNWGTHCGASRAAVAAYLGDTVELEATARVFKGWLGDRSAYASFSYGDTSWQCDPAKPVGINPAGCMKSGQVIDGVLGDDQRRAGAFVWPAPKENYVYEALQGALVQAVILRRAGYTDVFEWQNRALLRAFIWLHTQNNFPAEDDDTWQPHVINHFYGAAGANFPAPRPSSPGKNVGWTDWTFQGQATPVVAPVLSASPMSLTFTAQQGAANPAAQFVQFASSGSGSLNWTATVMPSMWVISSTSGSTPGSLSVRPSISGLEPGTYQGAIVVTGSGTQQSQVTIALSVSITAASGGGTSTVRMLGAVADTFVRGGSYAGKNFGTQKEIEEKNGSDASFDRRMLLKFDVRGGEVSGAWLNTYVSALPNGAPAPICAFAAADSWTETGVTWSNQPATGALIGCVTVQNTGWVSVDVTAFVKQERAGDGFATIVLWDPTQANVMIRLNSRESSANKPVLSIK